jgi:alpha-beta hydrolase superfamily lysophospholipase
VDAIADPTWITGSGAPIFAWAHRPASGAVRGGVVLCPPIGREYLASYQALRHLAVRLASVGLLVLRFDYRGTGDSGEGDTGSGQVAEWIGSVVGAAQFATAAAGGPTVLLGLRLGATLAAEASSRLESLDALVLWDPCPSPAMFLREQHLLHRLSPAGQRGPHNAGWLETPGMALPDETVEHLRELHWERSAPALAARVSKGAAVLLMTRANEALVPPLRELSGNPGVEHVEVTGQAELLETSLSAGAVREPTLDAIVSYVSRRFPSEARTVELPLSPTARIGVPRGAGDVVAERAIRLGSRELFGIVTEPLAGGAGARTVLLVTVAAIHHVGPSRQWVELARSWASRGARVVRFDVSGVGDSDALEGPKAYTARSVSDVIEAAEAASPQARGDVVLFGLCSGAWAASVAGVELGARAVYLVNQDQWHGTGSESDEPLSRESPHGSSGAAATFRRLRDRGVEVTVVVGPEDHAMLQSALSRSHWAEFFEPSEPRAAAQLRLLLIEELDHDLFTRSACRAIDEQVSPLVIASCGLQTGRSWA